MRSAPRLALGGILAVLLSGVFVPAAGAKPALGEAEVPSCFIEHEASSQTDFVNMLIVMGRDARNRALKLWELRHPGEEFAPIETRIALEFLAQGASKSAVVDGTDSGRLNKKGKATANLSFNSFGTYEVDITLTHKGFRPSHTSFKFSVTNTNGGACTIVG